MRIVVETYIMRSGKLESVNIIDHSVHSQRVWLGKHCQWAFNNGRGVQTYNERDQRSEAA